MLLYLVLHKNIKFTFAFALVFCIIYFCTCEDAREAKGSAAPSKPKNHIDTLWKRAPGRKKRSNRLIVKIKEGVNPVRFVEALKFKMVKSNLRESLEGTGKKTNKLHKAITTKANGTYVVARVADARIRQFLEKSRHVEYIEQDAYVEVHDIQQVAPWGLSRISQPPEEKNNTPQQRTTVAGGSILFATRKQPVLRRLAPWDNGNFNYPHKAGSGSVVYVVDTGVQWSDPEFEGRARHGFTTCGGCARADLRGHGTHVAATIAGRTFGVAKKAQIVSVKVIDVADGLASDMVHGIEWAIQADAQRMAVDKITSTIAKQSNKVNNTSNHVSPGIINMSLGVIAGDVPPQSLRDALARAVRSGMTVVLSAGNVQSDVCEDPRSLARIPGVIVVGASGLYDEYADFSNFGDCVSIFAPGVLIESLTPEGTSEFKSGTSMAAPHMSGAIALMQTEIPSLRPNTHLWFLSIDDAVAETPPGTTTRQLSLYFLLTSLNASFVVEPSVAASNTVPERPTETLVATTEYIKWNAPTWA